MVQDRVIFTIADNSKSYMVYRTVPLSTTLNDPYSRLQGHVIIRCSSISEMVRHPDIVSTE